MDEQTTEFKVPSYLTELITEAQDTSGYRISIGFDEEILFGTVTHLGSSCRGDHQVAIAPDYRDHAIHCLAIGVLKIVRCWRAPPSDRLLPTAEVGTQLPDADYFELGLRIPNGLESSVDGISKYLYKHLGAQLTTFSAAMLTERELARTLEEHRPCQRRYVSQLLPDLDKILRPAVLEICPVRLLHASRSMSTACALSLADFSHVAVPEALLEPARLDTGRRLVQLANEVENSGYSGERQVVEAWEEALDMQGWCTWLPLEEEA